MRDVHQVYAMMCGSIMRVPSALFSNSNLSAARSPLSVSISSNSWDWEIVSSSNHDYF